jgi:hypothetical protein
VSWGEFAVPSKDVFWKFSVEGNRVMEIDEMDRLSL